MFSVAHAAAHLKGEALQGQKSPSDYLYDQNKNFY